MPKLCNNRQISTYGYWRTNDPFAPAVWMNSAPSVLGRGRRSRPWQMTKNRSVLGRVDKRDSHSPRLLIQDCFLRSSYGSWGLVGRGVGTDRAAAAA